MTKSSQRRRRLLEEREDLLPPASRSSVAVLRGAQEVLERLLGRLSGAPRPARPPEAPSAPARRGADAAAARRAARRAPSTGPSASTPRTGKSACDGVEGGPGAHVAELLERSGSAPRRECPSFRNASLPVRVGLPDRLEVRLHPRVNGRVEAGRLAGRWRCGHDGKCRESSQGQGPAPVHSVTSRAGFYGTGTERNG